MHLLSLIITPIFLFPLVTVRGEGTFFCRLFACFLSLGFRIPTLNVLGMASHKWRHCTTNNVRPTDCANKVDSTVVCHHSLVWAQLWLAHSHPRCFSETFPQRSAVVRLSVVVFLDRRNPCFHCSCWYC